MLSAMAGSAHHCSFVLLADFDIDRGAQLTYQFPQPLGTDDGFVVATQSTFVVYAHSDPMTGHHANVVCSLTLCFPMEPSDNRRIGRFSS